MTDPETIRARALLASSKETLERSLNRPRYESSWLRNEPAERPAPEPPRAAPVARNGGTMDPEQQARWDAWAKSIAQREALAMCKSFGDATGDVLKPLLAALQECDRGLWDEVLDLRERIDRLEAETTGKVAPLRAGGTRDGRRH